MILHTLIHVGISSILLKAFHHPTSLLSLSPLLALLALLTLLEALLIALLVAVLVVILVVVHVSTLIASLVSEKLFTLSDDVVHCGCQYLMICKVWSGDFGFLAL